MKKNFSSKGCPTGTNSKVSAWGPYRVSAHPQYVAFIVGGPYDLQDVIVCLLAPDCEDRIKLLTLNFDSLFRSIMQHVSAHLLNWHQFYAFSAIMQEGSTSMRINTYTGSEKLPERIAEDILKSLTFTHTLERNGRRYLVRAYEIDVESGMTLYSLQQEGNDKSFRLLARSLEQLPEVIDLQPELNHLEGEMYVQEAIQGLLGGDLRSAFRSFYHGLLLERDLPDFASANYIGLGIELARRLRENIDPDYAEWTAVATGELAAGIGRDEDAAKAFQLAGISASDLGKIHATGEHYRSAAAHLSGSVDPAVAASVRMSYGLSYISLLTHVDFDPDTDASAAARINTLLDVAEQQLQQARSLTEKSQHRRRNQRLMAIDLDLARIADLRGRHDDAMRALKELHPTEDKHRATLIVYRLAALRHLAQEDPSQLETYQYAVNTAMGDFLSLQTHPTERLCWYFVACAEILQAAGQHRDAVLILQRALDAQRRYSDPVVRPSGSTEISGGLGRIDIFGRLQYSLAAIAAEVDGEEHAAWRAFVLADEAKGRYFARDLAFSARTAPNLSPYLNKEGRTMREAMIRGTIDPRILLADYKWFLDHDVGAEAMKQTRSGQTMTEPVTQEELDQLLSTVGETTAFLSFYATSDRTLMYLYEQPGREPYIAVLHLDVRKLSAIVRNLLTGMNGNEIYPQIDALQPEKHDRFFRDFMEMKRIFEPLMALLERCQHLVISPHGLWHSLPLHAILLPLFWHRGLCPGISYVPTAKIGRLLLQRKKVPDRLAHRLTGLVSVPATDDEAPIMAEIHQSLTRVFTQTGQPPETLYGPDATPDATLGLSLRVGLLHLLAHGRFVTDRDAMTSAILLADGRSLPSKDAFVKGEPGPGKTLTAAEMMVNGTSAHHITLQACSVGRHQTGAGDELWGVTRALLAAGADSVIAPLWDVDPISSTALLQKFYTEWLLAGRSKSEALALAQRQLAKTPEHPEWRHFYHWGAFQLVGCF